MTKVPCAAYETFSFWGDARPIVVGFSVRALAEASAALGRSPIAIDHFADHDCRQVAAECYRIKHWGATTRSPQLELAQPLAGAGAIAHPFAVYPLDSVQRQRPSGAIAPPVMLGGGTENWPELIEWLHQQFLVLGPSLSQVVQLRNPDFWRKCVVGSGIGFPVTWTDAVPTARAPAPVGWLAKPVRGAGGLGVERVAASIAQRLIPAAQAGREHSTLLFPDFPDVWQRAQADRPKYWQQEIAGRSLGVYCNLSRRRIEILGATESWLADDWPGPRPFNYRGSWGPLMLSQLHSEQVIAVCRQIQSSYDYVGWLQLDFIEDASEKLWLLELNPRWAAGMEILFLAGLNPVASHVAVWQEHLSGVASTVAERCTSPTATAVRQFGKAIVYTDRELRLTARGITELHALPRNNFADLPAVEMAGEIVAAGQPLVTVRTACESQLDSQQTRERLLQQLHQLRELGLATASR